MLSKRIIPKLDIKGPNVIKGVRMEGLKIIGDPSELSMQYNNQAADEIVYIDTVASLYGRNNLHDIVRRVTEQCFVPTTVGGGIRTIENIRTLCRIGADKVAINTQALKTPTLISEAAQVFGSQAITISIHAKKEKDRWICYAENGRENTQVEVIKWAKEVERLGAGEILLLSIDQDGTYAGFDLDLIRAVVQSVNIPVVAAGGAGNVEDVQAVLQIKNVSGVCLSSILHHNRATITDIKQYLHTHNVPVRLEAS